MRSWLQAVFLAKSASVQFEPADFNVSAALINNGVDISTIPELAALSRRDAVNGCSIACSALQKIYGDATVLSEGNSEYNEFHGAYWSAQQGAVNPQCVFKPKSSLEVSTLVLVARLSQCQFAVKGGGHAAFAGASSIEDGITVSLENLDTVKVADDKQFVDVGPGNRWIDVYNSIDKQNVGVVGGRMSPVGVSGLTLGGGISFFSNKLGWACDNVASYELVTASGKVINVDQKTYPDMYRALRGGGNNFGVVTNFKMNAFPLGQMWGGQRIYSENNFAAVLDAIHKFSTTGSNTDQDAAQLVSFSAIPQLGNIAIVQMHYAKPTSSAPVFADLNTIPSVMDNTDLGTLGNMTDKMNQGQVDGQRQTMWDISLKVDRELFTYLTTTFYANMASVANIDGIFPIVSIQAITDGQLQGMQKNGGNTLGLDAKKGPYFIMNLSAKWNKASDDEAVMKFMSTFIQQVKAEAQRRGLDNEYIYMNYGSQYQDPIASYGAENVRRLMEVSRKYDPTGVFQTLQPGGFKIGKGAPNPHMP